MNRLTNTHQNVNYWSMSPSDFSAVNTIAPEFIQHTIGFTGGTWVSNDYGLRPVIKCYLEN